MLLALLFVKTLSYYMYKQANDLMVVSLIAVTCMASICCLFQVSKQFDVGAVCSSVGYLTYKWVTPTSTISSQCAQYHGSAACNTCQDIDL